MSSTAHTTSTRTPRMSGQARELLAAVCRDDVEPGQGWGFYTGDPSISARDWLFRHGYIRDAVPADGLNGIYAPTAEGRARWLGDIEARQTARGHAAERVDSNARLAAVTGGAR